MIERTDDLSKGNEINQRELVDDTDDGDKLTVFEGREMTKHQVRKLVASRQKLPTHWQGKQIR